MGLIFRGAFGTSLLRRFGLGGLFWLGGRCRKQVGGYVKFRACGSKGFIVWEYFRSTSSLRRNLLGWLARVRGRCR